MSLLSMKNLLDKNSVQGILKMKGLVDNEPEKREPKLTGAPVPCAQFGRDSRQPGGVPRCMSNPANLVIRSTVFSKSLKLVSPRWGSRDVCRKMVFVPGHYPDTYVTACYGRSQQCSGSGRPLEIESQECGENCDLRRDRWPLTAQSQLPYYLENRRRFA